MSPILSIFPKFDLELGPWILGGAALSYFEDGHFDNANDIDVYFRTRSQFYAVEDFLLQNGGISEQTARFPNDYDRPRQREQMSYINYYGYTFNLIGFIFRNTAENHFKSFDFTVCMLATDGYNFIAGDKRTFDDIKNKTLRFHDYEYLKSWCATEKTENRIQRYIRKGFLPDDEMTLYILKDFGS